MKKNTAMFNYLLLHFVILIVGLIACDGAMC